MKIISDNEIIDTSRGHKRIGALFDENAMLHATNKDLLSVQADLIAALEASLAWVQQYHSMKGHEAASYCMAAVIERALAKARGA